MRKKQIDKAIEYMGGSKLYSWQIEQIKELWPSVKKQLRRGIYAQVNTVARSGMSRTISVYIIHKKEMVNLNNTPFWRLYGDSRKDRTHAVRIGGCGMDMLFEASYRLFNCCFGSRNKRAPYQTHLGRYKDI